LALGSALFAVGVIGTSWAQLVMGASWRVGVARDERTALVTRGPYRFARNPIYSFMLLAYAGITLVSGHSLGWVGTLLALAGIELQVRWVEEPHLLRVQGEPYARYLECTGRFLPWLGRS
jgi:protein-S-isoprenylcysteine O-methyltransferase Ste14